MKNNLTIILAAVLITGAVFILFRLGNSGIGSYMAIAAMVGGGVGLYLGYRFLMAYIGRGKKGDPKLYAELRTYESPVASGEITFYFDLPESSHVKFGLTSLDGSIHKLLIDENKEEGSYPVTFNTGELSNGTYYYELVTGNQTSSKKLIIDNG